MSRRVPIDNPPPAQPEGGAHRAENVTARRLTEMERQMADFQALLARLSTVEAAAQQVGQNALADAAAQLEPLVASIEAALGVSPDAPPQDPNAPA